MDVGRIPSESGDAPTPLPYDRILVLVMVLLGDTICMSVILPFVPFMVEGFLRWGRSGAGRSTPRRRRPDPVSSGKDAYSFSSSRRSRRRIRNWRAPASPRPRYAVDARHLHTGLLAAAVARGQEPLALPAPLPVELAAGPQLERDAPLLILYIVFVYINITSVY